jgi:hypothetical protein
MHRGYSVFAMQPLRFRLSHQVLLAGKSGVRIEHTPEILFFLADPQEPKGLLSDPSK